MMVNLENREDWGGEMYILFLFSCWGCGVYDFVFLDDG
jgi:hypothetical protein